MSRYKRPIDDPNFPTPELLRELNAKAKKNMDMVANPRTPDYDGEITCGGPEIARKSDAEAFPSEPEE